MLKKSFEIVSPNGLHARPAAALARVCNQYESNVFLAKGDEQVNAKSIMGLLTLAAGPGAVIDIIVEGGEEADTMQAIEDEITQDLAKALQ